jgi:hypothetical protein
VNERGSVLAQVLVFSAVAGLMCATILHARLQPALSSARAVDRVRGDLAAQATVNRVTAVWSRLGSCSSDSREGVSCVGQGCDCRCAVSTGGLVIGELVSAAQGGACRLDAAERGNRL